MKLQEIAKVSSFISYLESVWSVFSRVYGQVMLLSLNSTGQSSQGYHACLSLKIFLNASNPSHCLRQNREKHQKDLDGRKPLTDSLKEFF